MEFVFIFNPIYSFFYFYCNIGIPLTLRDEPTESWSCGVAKPYDGEMHIVVMGGGGSDNEECSFFGNES